MAKSNTQDLTVGNPFWVILKFAIPAILGNLFQLFYTLADSIIVGKTLGGDALAAVGATSTIVAFVLFFITGFTGGFGICLGQSYGAKDEDKMRKSIASSTLLSIIITIIITIICHLSAKNILFFIDIPSNIYKDAYDYMYIVLIGSGATIFYNLISNLFRALGDSKTPLYFLIISSLLNIFLDLYFIIPWQMGVIGAALATVLAQFISAFLCLLVGLKKYPILHLVADDFKDLHATNIWQIKTAFPMGFQMSIMSIGIIAMQKVANSLGTTAITGYTAASKVDQISVLINTAMSVALSTYVAQNFGARNQERIKAGVRMSLIQLELLNCLMTIGIIAFKEPLISLFLNNPSPEILSYTNKYLMIVAPCYWILGILIIYRTAIQSMQNSKIPFLACIIELFSRLAVTILLSKKLGYIAVCIASPAAWIFASILLVPSYYLIMHYFAIDY